MSRMLACTAVTIDGPRDAAWQGAELPLLDLSGMVFSAVLGRATLQQLLHHCLVWSALCWEQQIHVPQTVKRRQPHNLWPLL